MAKDISKYLLIGGAGFVLYELWQNGVFNSLLGTGTVAAKPPAPGPGVNPPTTCNAGFHLDSGKCVVDTTTPPPAANQPVTCGSGLFMYKGSCTVWASALAALAAPATTATADGWNYYSAQLEGKSAPDPVTFLPAGWDRSTPMSVTDYVNARNGNTAGLQAIIASNAAKSGANNKATPIAEQLTKTAGTQTATADTWNYFWKQITGTDAPAPEDFLPEGTDRGAVMTATDYSRYRGISGFFKIGGFAVPQNPFLM